jgi:hypothetical protein
MARSEQAGGSKGGSAWSLAKFRHLRLRRTAGRKSGQVVERSPNGTFVGERGSAFSRMLVVRSVQAEMKPRVVEGLVPRKFWTFFLVDLLELEMSCRLSPADRYVGLSI